MTQPLRQPSLLERAAIAYDRDAPFRPPSAPSSAPSSAPLAPAVPIVAVAPEPVVAPMPDLAAIPPEYRAPAPHAGPDLSHIPAEFLARPGDEDVFVPPPPADGAGRVDRGMLAERGMIVPGAPVGPLAEEFRLIKRQLLVTRRRLIERGASERARSLLVCSARPGDGKTFCAVNLALSLAAEHDSEVLLVDADVAKPQVPAALGLTPGPGLLDAIADPGLDVETLVIATDIPGLSVLPAGARSAGDTEALASARTQAVIARLLAADPRRLIVFDSPPALAASAASVLAMLVGQVMLVVRADRTPESEVAAAAALLDGCADIQLVLNAIAFTPNAHRFGSYYEGL